MLSQTPNATRNMAEFNRSKFSRKTKMTNISQQQPMNILKPLFLSVDKGSLSCVLIGQNLISIFFFIFIKFTKACFAFCHSVTSFRFIKQSRASVSSFSKLNLVLLKLTSFKHKILVLKF